MKNAYDILSKEEVSKVYSFCEGYKKFLDSSKTERLCLEECLAQAKAAGFTAFDPEGGSLEPGSKVYYVNKNKNLFLAVIGNEALAKGARISAAHIDSPRLDVQPLPFEENSGAMYFRTHLYGWLRKHHYLARALALHGVVVKADGSVVTVCIGEHADDPVFVINDLLPHIGRKQNEAPLKDVIANSSMKVMVGSIPVAGEGDDRIKKNILALLNERYGISEEDFISAELEFVPVGTARDGGLDRSLVCSYAQDDKVCAYPQLQAILSLENPVKTAVAVFTDKEEVNSDGVSGMKSAAFDMFMRRLCRANGADADSCYENSLCFSLDVTSAFDPNFAEYYDRSQAAFINCGVAMCKFTDHGGDKSDGSDASAETVAHFRKICLNNDVIWQSAQIGDPEAGGGGTIAQYMANRGIETLDVGVPVLSMHAPVETTSKTDIYMCYKAVLGLYTE